MESLVVAVTGRTEVGELTKTVKGLITDLADLSLDVKGAAVSHRQHVADGRTPAGRLADDAADLERLTGRVAAYLGQARDQINRFATPRTQLRLKFS